LLKGKNKEYVSYLVIENSREIGKIKHRVMANISKLPIAFIHSITNLFKDGIKLDDITKI
jgi:hypothetical protein